MRGRPYQLWSPADLNPDISGGLNYARRVNSTGRSSARARFAGVSQRPGGAYRRRAFGTWEGDAPGVSRHIRPTDLPPPSHHRKRPRRAGFQADAEGCRSAARQDAGCAKGLRGAGVCQGSETAPRHPGRTERRYLRGGKRERSGGKRERPRPGLPRRCGRRRAGDPRGLRRKPGAALRHRVRSAERPAARLCGRCEPDRPLPVPQRRPQGDRAGRGHDREYPHVAALDARPGGFAGRQTPLRLDRLGFQCCRHNAAEEPGGNSGL